MSGGFRSLFGVETRSRMGSGGEGHVEQFKDQLFRRSYGNVMSRVQDMLDAEYEPNRMPMPRESAAAAEALFSKMFSAGVTSGLAAQVVDRALERDIEQAKVRQAELAAAVVVVEDSSISQSVVSVSTESTPKSAEHAVSNTVLSTACEKKAIPDGYSYLLLVRVDKRIGVSERIGAYPELDRFLSIMPDEFDWNAVKTCSFENVDSRIYSVVDVGENGDAYDVIRRTLACYPSKGHALRAVVGELEPGHGARLVCNAVVGAISESQHVRNVGSDMVARLDRPVTVMWSTLEQDAVDAVSVETVVLGQEECGRYPVVGLSGREKPVVARRSVTHSIGDTEAKYDVHEYRSPSDSRVVIELQAGQKLEYGGMLLGHQTFPIHVMTPPSSQVFLFRTMSDGAAVPFGNLRVYQVGAGAGIWNHESYWPAIESPISEVRFAARSTVHVHVVPEMCRYSPDDGLLGSFVSVTDPFDQYAPLTDYRVTFDLTTAAKLLPACPTNVSVCAAGNMLTASGRDARLQFQSMVEVLGETSTVSWNVRACGVGFNAMVQGLDALSFHITAVRDAFSYDCMTGTSAEFN